MSATAQQLPFWIEVNEKAGELVADCARQKLQNAPSCVFITSIVSRRNRVSNARVSMAHLKLAAQRIVEGTHRISSDEEIQRYQDEQATRREEAKSREAALKGNITFGAAPPIPSVSKGD